MPEREISEEQEQAVKKWIKENGGKKLSHFPITIYEVNGEPLVTRFWYLIADKPAHLDIYCSDKQAQELETAGIVSFSEEAQKIQDR